jgi:uncharacterized membrane protein YczE
MLRPIHWHRFPRDFAVIQLGFALFGLSIAILIRANFGTNPWAVFEVALLNYLPITAGQASILVGSGVLVFALLLREPVGWGTVANIVFIGLWEDLFLTVMPAAHDNWLIQLPYLLLGVFAMGMATAIYIGVNAGAGPRDSLMLAVARTTGISVRLARTALEVAVVVGGWLLGGPAGLGTLIFALTIGPSVQAAFRLLKVNPHNNPNK